MKTSVGITDIEKAFYEMGKMDCGLQEYFFTYYSQKLILLNHFYPHIEGILPGFTDHGPNHIKRIMEIYGKMLKNNIIGLFGTQEVVTDIAFNYYEIYLLLCATVWHDVGNLLGRDEHNKKIIDIIDRLKNHFFTDDDLREYTLQIAKAHTGDDGVKNEIEHEDTNHKNEKIDLRFLGAVLRFADELDEGEVRIDSHYYKTMKDKISDDQKIYWETSLCIKRIEILPENSRIEIHIKINQKDLYKLFPKKKIMERNVALLDELVFRVDKINLERMAYMQFIRKHIEYEEVVLNLTIECDKNRKGGKPITFTFRFNNDQGYDAFWETYSQINPENKIEKYILQKRQ
jgi:metal-dependent HD superfamily phosphatase/phosphodiesterase